MRSPKECNSSPLRFRRAAELRFWRQGRALPEPTNRTCRRFHACCSALELESGLKPDRSPESIGVTWLAPRALWELGVIAHRQGDSAYAVRAFLESLELNRIVRDRYCEAWVRLALPRGQAPERLQQLARHDPEAGPAVA